MSKFEYFFEIRDSLLIQYIYIYIYLFSVVLMKDANA